MSTEEQQRLEMLEAERNLPINSAGLRGKLIGLLNKGDVDSAKQMFATHAKEADDAIKQLNTSTHTVMKRANKTREGKPDYETCKLPRALQSIINKVINFMMFGNPLKFTLENRAEEIEELQDAFSAFEDFLQKVYFNERMSEAKLIAGSETESAKLYRLYTNEDGEAKVVCQVLANSKAQRLYPMINQYGEMVAFGVGYYLQSDTQNVTEEHFDVYTKHTIFKCTKGGEVGSSWHVESENNGFAKIPVIYYNQEVEWQGAQERIERLENVDSRRGDTNNYFGDPYLTISREIANDRLAGPEEAGKVIVLDGPDSKFEFVAPPDCGDNIENEKSDLFASILHDTMTPDLSYKSIMGLGTLSGEAMRRMSLPGYIKRGIRSIDYNPLIRREINLIIAIMCNYTYLDNSVMRDKLQRLKIKFDYQDPFIGNIDDNADEIAALMGAGAMSIESAVGVNRFVNDKAAEIERIRKDKEFAANLESQTSMAQAQQTATDIEEE